MYNVLQYMYYSTRNTVQVPHCMYYSTCTTVQVIQTWHTVTICNAIFMHTVLLYSLIVCSTSCCHVSHHMLYYIIFCITYCIDFVQSKWTSQQLHNYNLHIKITKQKIQKQKKIKTLQKKSIIRFCFKFLPEWYAS